MTAEPMTPKEQIVSNSRSLWSREFIFLFAATFLAYANISVFFQFYKYLHTLPIDPRWFGLLMGVFSAVSLVVRPIISPFFHTRNARRYLYIGTTMVIATLVSYSLAGSFWSMFMVRCLHGLAFVILGTALMTITIDFIPEERSAQAFGLLAIIILIPNTMVPPILPFLTQGLGGFTTVLILFAGITVLVFPLILGAGPPGRGSGSETASRPLNGHEILEDIKDIRIFLILVAMLLLYCGYALVFFFLDGYGRSTGIAGTGFFLTLATMSEIGVRLGAGSFFDRVNKARLATWTMVGLAIGYAALGHVPGKAGFFALGVVLGLGWGVAMPVFNGLMFDISAPKFRAFNTNLGLQMFQGGFFLGPFIGGPVVAHWSFQTLFHMCAAFSLVSAGFTLYLRGKISE